MRTANLAFDLKMAIRTKKYDIIKELVEKNIDLSMEMDGDKTLLELMAEVKQWELVDFIAKNRKAQKQDEVVYSKVLLEAAFDGRLDSMRHLIKAGASLSWESQKKTIIELMSETQQWEKVNVIAKCKKTDEKDEAHYSSALIDAVLCENVEVVENLLKAGAGFTWIIGNEGDSPFHIAIRNNQTEMIALLLRYGKETVDRKNDEGKTPYVLSEELKSSAVFNSGWEMSYRKTFPKDILRVLIQGHRQEGSNLSKLPIELVDYTTQFLWKDRKYLNTRTVCDQLKRNSLRCFVNNYSSGFFHFKSTESEKLVNDVKKLLDEGQHDDAQKVVDDFLETRLKGLPQDKYVKSRAVELLKKFGLTCNKPLKEDPHYPGYFRLAGP